jgi:hypothetical protein
MNSAVLHPDEAAVNGPSFCYRVHTDSQRMFCESGSRTLNSLFRVSRMHVNKKQPFRRGFDEKTACAMKSDASMSQKTAATSLPRRCVQRVAMAQRRLSIGTNGTFSGPV